MSAERHRPGVAPLAALIALIAFASGGGEAIRSNESTRSSLQAPQHSGDTWTALAEVQGYDCAALVSELEIDELIGLTGTKLHGGVRGDENDVLPGHTQCGYELPQDHVLGISVYSGAGFGEALETFEFVWEMAEAQGAEALTGIGERALLHADFASGPRVLARVGGLGVLVGAGDLQGLGKLDLEDVIQRVLAIIVGRL